jgi:RNA polymerase sigma factor (sigma-70 family)
MQRDTSSNRVPVCSFRCNSNIFDFPRGYNGDFDAAASRYSSVLFRVALRKLRNVEDAEDAVQEALLKGYEHIGQFQGRSKLSSWLVSIVINAAGMKMRSRMRREVVSLDDPREGGVAPIADRLTDRGSSPEDIYEKMESRELLRRTISQLPPKLASALRMRDVAGFSTRETADLLKINVSAVKSRARRARIAVKQSLRAEFRRSS